MNRLLGPSKGKKAFLFARVAGPIVFAKYTLPSILQNSLNKALKLFDGYEGSIEKVKIQPIFGRLIIQGLRIEKKITRESALPLLRVTEISVKFHWKSLLAGGLIADLEITRPILDWDTHSWPSERSPRPDPERRNGVEASWQNKVKTAIPFRLSRILLRQGEVRVHGLPGQESEELRIGDIFAVIKNIKNTDKLGNSLPATLECRAQIMSTGYLKLIGKGYPFSQPPEFEAALEAKDIPLTDLSGLIAHHINATVRGGTFETYCEASARSGIFRGYLKPIVHHLWIESRPHQNLTHKIKAYAIKVLTKIMRNKKTDSITTKINFEGSLKDPHIEIGYAVANFMKDAFGKGFLSMLEHSIEFPWHSHLRELHYPPREKSHRGLFPLLKKTFQQWRANEAPQMAAALSYYTSFSLAPLLLLVFAVAGLAFGRAAVQGRVFQQLAGLVGSQSADAIQSMVAAAWQPSKSIWAIAIGTFTLIAGATGVLSALKDGLNRVWQTKEPENLAHIVKERAKFLGMILGIGFLLMVSLAVSAALAALGKFLAGYLPVPEVFEHILDLVISMGVITTLFAMIFKYIPDASIARRPLWAGAAFTAFLFTLGKLALGLYLGKGALGSSYGAAGAVLIILLWVYYSGLILYFGAQFTKVYADAQKENHDEH